MPWSKFTGQEAAATTNSPVLGLKAEMFFFRESEHALWAQKELVPTKTYIMMQVSYKCCAPLGAFHKFHAEWVWEEITKVPNSNQDCKLQRWRTPAETATRDTSFISKSPPMSVPHRTHKATVQDSLLVNTQSVQTAHRVQSAQVQSRSSRSGRGDKHAATFRGFKEWKASERTLPSWWKF